MKKAFILKENWFYCNHPWNIQQEIRKSSSAADSSVFQPYLYASLHFIATVIPEIFYEKKGKNASLDAIIVNIVMKHKNEQKLWDIFH